MPIWEMQGELGTSHCYEFGGDYRAHPRYGMGKLGCSYELSKNKEYYVFKNILFGDSTNVNEISPLLAPAVNIKQGDHLLAINGTKVNENVHPRELLVNFGGQDITLSIQRKGKKLVENVVVKTLNFEYLLLYRNWVEKNREYVHQKSNNKIGYIHIPDMGTRGFAEFHRNYLVECQYDALIVDVRFNGDFWKNLTEKLWDTRFLAGVKKPVLIRVLPFLVQS
ncbi:MAG: PDZ domain-containing protein [Candidatus Cloacimonetes bacterium]|nr:PDZ domain-containing protein [Candidatus Cloacimonadota bacterium]